MACFSPKPLYQTSEPTMASAALVQANRFAQQGRYDQALRLLDGEEDESPTSLMVRMVCEWKGLKDLDRALATYDVLRACNEAPPPLLAAAVRNADGIRLEIKINAIREAQEVRATTIQEHASAAYKFEAIDLEEPCTSDLRFHALYGAGLHWYQGEDYSRSAQCVDAALECKDEFAPAWHILGECRRHLGDATGALEAFSEACERAETKHVRDAASRGRVEALIFNGRDAEALEALEALEVDAEVLYWRGLAKSRLGQHASAVDDLDAAASKMTSVDVADAVARARCRAGVASLASGDILHARRHFSVVASQKYAHHQEHFHARFNVAVCDARSGNLDKAAAGFQALADYERGGARGPDFGRAWAALADVQLASQRWAAAVENYELASVDDADALHNLGYAAFRAGLLVKSRAAFKQVILRRPDCEKAQRAMKLVVSALDARSKRRRATLARLAVELDHLDLGSPSSPALDATEALERLHNDAVGPLNAIKLQGQESGTVDNPYDPQELPAVAKAEAACRAAMKASRALDRLRSEAPRDAQKDAAALDAKRVAEDAVAKAQKSNGDDAEASIDEATQAVSKAADAAATAATAADDAALMRTKARREARAALEAHVNNAVEAVLAAVAADHKAHVRHEKAREKAAAHLEERAALAQRLFRIEDSLNKRAARADAIEELQHARACGAVAAQAIHAAEDGPIDGALAAADAFEDAASAHAKACTALLEEASRNEACDRLQGRLSKADTDTASTRDAARRDGLGEDVDTAVKSAARALNHAVVMLKAARDGNDVADARRAVADAIGAAADLSQKAAALRLDGGRRRADAARRKAAEELSQHEKDEAASSTRALDFYEKLAKPGRYEPIAFESDAPKPAEEAIVCYALAALAVDASKLPKGVDASRRERHLSPDAFRAAFGVGATAFRAWPKWRQALAKRKVGLY